MEKNMKKIRQEMREKDAEIVKLKENRDQLTATIDELREGNRQHDLATNNLQKQISGTHSSFNHLSFLSSYLPTYPRLHSSSSPIRESILTRQDDQIRK
jgi:chromosome segregation ATPase